MTRYYCTYFDKNYLVKALALMESLSLHEKNPYVLYAICLDEISRVMLEKFNVPNVVTVPLHQIEMRNPTLAAARENRSLVEYYWTLTPTIIYWLFENNHEVDSLTYIDADMYFFSSPDPVFEEFNGFSVVIHEHRFPEEFKSLEVHGKYNVGLLCFRRDSDGLKVLSWWRDRCLEWCYARLEDGKFGDQLYLNSWPEQFAGVKVLEHIGAGVAPWNHTQYSFQDNQKFGVMVDTSPLIFYHFHSFTFVMPGLIIPAKYPQYSPMRYDIVKFCVLPYVDHLHRLILSVRSVLPSFAFGIESAGSLAENHTIVVHGQLRTELESIFEKYSKVPAPRALDDTWWTYNCK
jgi:hypothetical protein